MSHLLRTFKIVSVVFAIASVATGARAIVDPIGFSKSFGLPLSPTTSNPETPAIDNDEVADRSRTRPTSPSYQHDRNLTMSYVSLMGVRQLGTGTILLTFAYQDKWTEMATILAIIGILVAGTDGVYLSRSGARELGLFHAIPGALISALAIGLIRSNA